ncbi:AAA family ATPase [Methanococcoides methylutens]|uniref:CO dehydrogenase accessory protein CooC (Nickel insertion) n=1 Tax=Methanococcoides methylutens MM1 TaxID=1434104 RepID=A0A0E3SQQ4_METMT|nr:carbon monoxide dehydrogenase accessory protein CooC [Methanococcoides methylutens]AKB85046.1 CO dehydrogenase accessory protein CooC (nickel insertion) [Methanococcoides methylutens MM1]
MAKVIAITGKGGTGKTAITSLLIRHLTKTDKLVLAIDADPDTNLPETLGCETIKTVGDMKQFMQDERDNFPPDVNKETIFESKIYEILEEMDNYDLIVMGRPEGSGCYCYVNNLLRGIMDKVVKNYDVVILDTEAGLEHFSRKIIRDVDDLIVVTDGSRRGLRTAERIRELTEELETNVKNIYVVANKVTDTNKDAIKKTAEGLDLELIGTVPMDSMIAERDLEGLPLFDLSDDSDAVQEVAKIAEKLGL